LEGGNALQCEQGLSLIGDVTKFLNNQSPKSQRPNPTWLIST